MQSVQNKIALVTGANTGVGFQIAKALAENNYTVYVGARNPEKGNEAVRELGENAVAIELDVTKNSTIQSAAEKIGKEHGYLDLLVNNAGISNAGTRKGTMEEMLAAQMPSVASISEMKKVWDTNVFGALAVTQAFLPLLHKASAPRIVNVSSSLGSLTLNQNPSNPYRKNFDVVYGASKAAMNAITVSLANELEGTNIKVNAVSPGFTATALNNFQGTDSVEEGSKEPIRVALDESGVSGQFTGPHQEVYPW
ncbi:NAD(P)-dependent dehydrogenase (short-subunit alcohol dehydrogenase family) [Algoriphagus sp. 4150]|uniref:SDR family NAD(P)-dependent oxidoreductase n=1 Tax=Algoriphagus sp. 4150 TaxID=2817756 RepID=UPI00285D7536|nr:SDR family NAD(P)-dependent oxidoreductase [Algoriphagus sp. 4150]MDR7128142.1 NAD(P)-dependent dehydrogenase (short-subunit alcohol dehydrogenase family) [Algoriphagus sp. 4150]